MKWLISKCLLGDPCRYDGQSKPSDKVCHLASNISYTGVCPEVAGGLATPRIPSEYNGEVVSNADGTGVDFAYRLGAKYTVNLAGEGPVCCILKEKSPSCGTEKRYDGTFTSTLVDGEGVTAQALYDAGICAVSEVVVDEVLTEISHGLNIIYRIDTILPALAARYTADLNQSLSDLSWDTTQVRVVGEGSVIPQDLPCILIDVCDAPSKVYTDSSMQVRSSHQAKKNYLLSCLLGEAMQADPVVSADDNESCSALFAHGLLECVPMPYSDIVDLLARTTRRLHDFLYIA